MLTTITANDVDSSPALTYRFGNATDPGPFSIDRYGGKVVLRRRLDAETRSEYSLQVVASDGIHEATTDLIVRVTDLNDNAPRFQQSAYIATLPGESRFPFNFSPLPVSWKTFSRKWGNDRFLGKFCSIDRCYSSFPVPWRSRSEKRRAREEREREGRWPEASLSARNKREFKNWFLVDTRCLVARVPNSN